MNNNSNFLLKIHIEEEGKVTEISLNKNNHIFVFENDECVSDFVLPNSKITTLNLSLESIINDSMDDGWYVEYDKDGETKREYDKEKILMLKEIVTNIDTNDFFKSLDNVKINNYYIDNITGHYNCKLDETMQKILSFTTNGATFSDVNVSLICYEEIVDYPRKINDFIPFMLRNNKNYIGYDYKTCTYKEFDEEGNMIKENENLQELLHEKMETKDIVDVTSEESISELPDESKMEKYDNTIKNIDYQFAKLNVGLNDDVDNSEKIKEEKKKIKDEIVEGVRQSLSKIEETNNLIDEIDNNFEKIDEQLNDDKIVENIEVLKVDENDDSDEEEIEVLDFAPVKSTPKQTIKKEQKKTDKKVVELINKSLKDGVHNYKINFNDTQKLVIEHLPYYEFSNSFDIIQIPEIELNKITLLPELEINLEKIKFRVKSLTNKKVELLVESAPNIVDQEGNKLTKGKTIVIALNKLLNFRLNKKNAMETWSIKMEKSTFQRELRNIDYGHIMNIISNLDSFKSLGSIEKYELQKSIMLFINFVMQDNDIEKLNELYRILEEEPILYEEFVTRYNIDKTLEKNALLPTYESKKEFMIKLNYINGLIDAKWLDYPRYIFASYDYFKKDDFLQDFITELDDAIDEKDFSDYLLKLFKEYKLFVNLDEEGKENLEKCLEYLSVVYKYYPSIGEENKYKIEREFMIGADEEYISLLISKLCRRGIKDYSAFIEYDTVMKEKYRLGELKYPIFSDSFGLEEIREGGEYDEY